jgi:hypothetical protein
VRRLVLAAAVLTLALAAPGAAADYVSATMDSVGDCTASPCADIVGGSVVADRRGVVFRVDVPAGWTFKTPLPQIWIWRIDSPDTAPPDATITDFGRIVGNAYPYDVSRGDYFPPQGNFAEISIDTDFVAALGGRFLWRAALPRDVGAKMDDQRPVDPQPADVAPDQGSVLFAAPDGDGDGTPDAADPCPGEAYSDPAPGWGNGYQHRGCPVALAPFTRAAFVASAKRSIRNFRAQWRDRARRAAIFGARRMTVPFRVPAGTGTVSMQVIPAVIRAPPRASVYGARRCPAGRCAVRLKVVPEGVRTYASRKLQLLVRFVAGDGRRAVVTAFSEPIRMPLP